MFEIPRYMNNEMSKAVAAVIIHQREVDLASAKLYGALNKVKKLQHAPVAQK